MLTASLERFEAIKNEAPAEYRDYLVHSSTYEAGSRCKVSIINSIKWLDHHLSLQLQKKSYSNLIPLKKDVERLATF